MFEDLTVGDVMTREYIGVSEGDTVEAATELLLTESQSAVAVVRGSEPIGLVQQRDLLSSFVDGTSSETATVGDVMRRSPPTIDPAATVLDAAGILGDAEIDHVFVTTGSELRGVLSQGDVIAAIASRVTPTEATSALDTAQTEVASPPEEAATSTQSVCEQCGGLKADLAPVDGQLLCGDCRAI